MVVRRGEKSCSLAHSFAVYFADLTERTACSKFFVVGNDAARVRDHLSRGGTGPIGKLLAAPPEKDGGESSEGQDQEGGGE